MRHPHVCWCSQPNAHRMRVELTPDLVDVIYSLGRIVDAMNSMPFIRAGERPGDPFNYSVPPLMAKEVILPPDDPPNDVGEEANGTS